MAPFFYLGATYTRHQVISYVTKTSTCHHTLHTNHWHCLWETPPITANKSNITTVNEVHFRYLKCDKMLFTVSKHADYKCVCDSPSRAPRALTTGIVSRKFPSLRCTTWRNNGGSARNGSPFGQRISLLSVENTNIQWKMPWNNRD